jgi:sec-independent protein translocase protein TatB
MFDVGFDELLVIVIVAIVVIGPKDLPKALRIAGQWIGKVRRVSGHFRSGVEAMIREAELEEMERKWREQNAAIMAAHPEQTPDASNAAEVAPLASPASSLTEVSPPTQPENKA